MDQRFTSEEKEVQTMTVKGRFARFTLEPMPALPLRVMSAHRLSPSRLGPRWPATAAARATVTGAALISLLLASCAPLSALEPSSARAATIIPVRTAQVQRGTV